MIENIILLIFCHLINVFAQNSNELEQHRSPTLNVELLKNGFHRLVSNFIKFFN